MSEHERETVLQPGYLVDHPDLAEHLVGEPTGKLGDFEKRQHERVEINTELRCIEDYIAEYVMSLSQGGVFIRSRKPLAVGTRVTLKFTVILDDIETVEGEGEVVRVETSGPNMGMGVAFTRLTAESKALVDEVLARAQRIA